MIGSSPTVPAAAPPPSPTNMLLNWLPATTSLSDTTPLPNLPIDGSALWNSLAQIDEQTVIAVMTVRGLELGGNGVWTVKGKIVRK